MWNASISRRIMMMLAASVATTLAVILGLSYLLRVSSNAAQRAATTATTQNQVAFDLLGSVVKIQGGTQRLVQETDPDAMESLMHQNEILMKEAEAKIARLASDQSSVMTSFHALVQANQHVTDLLLHAHNAESHQAIIENLNPAFEGMLRSITESQDQVRLSLEEEAGRVRVHIGRIQFTIYILGAIGVLILIVGGLSVVRGISRALNKMIERVKDVAEGERDLTKRVEVTSRDELGELARWFNTFLEKQRQLLSQLAEISEHVAAASEEISSSATEQANSAETQKDQATQIATAMQEMSSTVLQVSEHSNKAAESSRQAAETARQGGVIVEETLGKMRLIVGSVGATAKKMEELGKSSDQIGRIVGVIDDIADQTNLLALNAAIEAARAGEQGRGFAVVADEVRKLAERTTTATKEIAQMIKNIQDETKAAVGAMEDGTRQVEEGVSSTAKAGDSLKDIIQMADQVGGMIMQIATASTEQSSTSEEINKNMEQIAKLVKESAVGAQQSAKACQDLSGLALDLQKMVDNFKLDRDGNRDRNTRRLGDEGRDQKDPKAFAAGAH